MILSDSTSRTEAHELTNSPWLLQRWMSARPRVLDWIVAVSCGAVQIATLILNGASLDWAIFIVIAFTSLALLWRRSHPLTVLVTVVALSSASSFLHTTASYQNAPFVFALYALASIRPFKPAIGGYFLGVLIPASAAVVQGITAHATVSPVLLDPFALFALAIGLAVRGQREHRQALVELINQRLDTARLTERNRITADMHDVVAHSLSVMIALANGASAAWQKHPERAAEALRDLTEVGRTAQFDMRRILQMIQEGDADSAADLLKSGHNLPSLENLVETFRATGLPVSLAIRGTPLSSDVAFAMSVHRIVQEGLTNALRYALDATRVEVTITGSEHQVEITIVDNGLATATGQHPTHGSERGLLGIAARARTYNGTSTAEALRTGGWRVAVVLEKPNQGQESNE